MPRRAASGGIQRMEKSVSCTIGITEVGCKYGKLSEVQGSISQKGLVVSSTKFDTILPLQHQLVHLDLFLQMPVQNHKSSRPVSMLFEQYLPWGYGGWSVVDTSTDIPFRD